MHWTHYVSQICPEAQAQEFGFVQVSWSDCEDRDKFALVRRGFLEEEGKEGERPSSPRE